MMRGGWSPLCEPTRKMLLLATHTSQRSSGVKLIARPCGRFDGGSIVCPLLVNTVPSSDPARSPSSLTKRFSYGPRKSAATDVRA
jgi:hypothetical protein